MILNIRHEYMAHSQWVSQIGPLIDVKWQIFINCLAESVSDEITPFLAEKLPNLPNISVTFCIRVPFERTDRVVNIELYDPSWLIKFRCLEVLPRKSYQLF